MMRALIVAALFLAVVFATSSDEEQFVAWQREHDKSFSPEEYPVRLQHFKNNLRKIERLNAQSSGGAVFATNKFSGLSEDEFKDLVLMKPQVEPELVYDGESRHAARSNPTAFDWRSRSAVTAVKDQGQCGSCWAFSATEAIESAWILAGKATASTLNLAPQQIVDCDTTNSGCNGGWPDKAMTYVHNAGGQEGAANYPYKAANGACAFNSAYVKAKVTTYRTATSKGDETTMQTNLVSWGPLSICLDASQFSSYSRGVMTTSQCCPSGTCTLNHCVQLVGYNSTASPPYWIVRNSWGTGWGNAGYIYLQMGGNNCGLTNHVTYPTVTI